MPEFVTWATLFGLIVVPLATLAFSIHVSNLRSRAVVERQRRRQNKRLFKRLDHLDQCIDDVRDRVTRVEAAHRPPVASRHRQARA